MSPFKIQSVESLRDEIIAVLQQEFGGEPDEIAGAVDELLDALRGEGLI